MSTFGKIKTLLSAEERRAALWLFALMFVGMGMETLGVGMVVPVMGILMEADVGASYPRLRPLLAWLGNPTREQLVTGGVLALFLVYLIKSLYIAFLSWRQNKYAADVRVHLSQRLFTIYLRQPYTFHLQRNSAQLMRNITTEVSNFGTAVTQAMSLVAEGLVLVGIGTLLLVVEPLGTVIVVAVLASVSAIFHYATRARLLNWGVERQHHDWLRLKQIQQGLGGTKDIKLLGRESDFLSQYYLHNSRSAHAGLLQSTLGQLPRLWLELLAVGSLTTLVLIMLAQGRDVARIMPTLALFAVAAFRLMPSANRLIMGVQFLRFSRPVIDILAEETAMEAPPPARRDGALLPFRSRIRLTGVSYTYEGAQSPALNDVTLAIEMGLSVGFIGPTGCGKSTLVDVILGLLPVDRGQVTVDGQAIQGNIRGWQDQIGYVSQSIYLVDDTVRRNVAFGVPEEETDDVAVRRAITAAQLDEFLDSLPSGMHTIVGERGVRLSGGQRQRIGIARALYHNPAVLVLDEATSALDQATERAVMDSVMALRGRKTLLIVAHRLSTVERCDKVYRLDSGRVIAEGSPGEILYPEPRLTGERA